MIIRRTIALIGAVAVAAGLSLAAAGPAAAKSTDASVTATCIGPWQYNSVGSNRAMESCVNAIGSGIFRATTRVISTSYWTGFHGCVRMEFLNSSGVIVHTSAQQRYGVDAGRTRTVEWIGSAPVDYYLYSSRFVHWRC